jgi:hypothetical protein
LLRGVRETYDLEGVGNDADSHELLSVVAAVHHEGVGKTLNDGALGLAETLLGVAAGGVRKVDGSADLDVVAVWSHRQHSCFHVIAVSVSSVAHDCLSVVVSQ